MLLHDIGKPYVKVVNEDGSDSFVGHDDKSVELAKPILDRLFFSEEEKKIILTLIKYHDKYINEGEITFDNMKFLASELNNDKELFYLLIEVKNADAMAKNVDVYNTFKIVKSKYLEFINSYFTYSKTSNSTNVSDNDGELKSEIVEEVSFVEMDRIIENIISRKNIVSLYQPIIDIENKKVFAYDSLPKINSIKKINLLELFNHAKSMELYDKVQQILLIDRMENFASISHKESDTIFITTDLISYSKYINKPRLYDLMAKQKVVIKFINYEKKDVTFIQELIETIHKNRGFVALNNFGIGSLKIEDLNLLNVDYIIPDRSLIQNIENDTEKQKFLSDIITYSISSNTKVIVIGIDCIETLYTVKKLGAKYVEGDYLVPASEQLNIISSEIDKILATDELEDIL